MLLQCRLAAFLVHQHGYPAGLMSLILKRFTEQAGFEKQTSAIDDLAGRHMGWPADEHTGVLA